MVRRKRNPHRTTTFDFEPSSAAHGPSSANTSDTIPPPLRLEPYFTPALILNNASPHRAAVLLDLPVELSDAPTSSKIEEPALHAHPSPLFVKHWELNKHVVRNVASFRSRPLPPHLLATLIERDSLTHSNTLLSIAIPTRGSDGVLAPQIKVAEIEFSVEHIPFAIAILCSKGALSLHVDINKSILQFVLHDCPISKKTHGYMVKFLGWLVNYIAGDVVIPTPAPFSREEVFDAVRRMETDDDSVFWRPHLKTVTDNDALHAQLRPYQQRAVAWMLAREASDLQSIDFSGQLWEPARRLHSDCLLQNDNVTIVPELALQSRLGLSWFGDDVKHINRAVNISRGGLLCDEMGLGKTVELMQLVLCNRLPAGTPCRPIIKRMKPNSLDSCVSCKERFEINVNEKRNTCSECGGTAHKGCFNQNPSEEYMGFICLSCLSRMSELVKCSTEERKLPLSKATLVVIPTALLLQWKNELRKHVKDALNIVIFEGLKKSGYIPQADLLNADVVLTTYDALRADVATVESLRKPRWTLRHARRYFPTPVPLLTVRWHRLALDESQMLGVTQNSSALNMARYLRATNRWCVTGTPISDDLNSALPMIGIVETYGDEFDWTNAFRPTPFFHERAWVLSSLRQLMWRTSKSDVEGGELELPPQIIETVRKKMGAVERYHYRSLQLDVARTAASLRQRGSDQLVNVSRDMLTTLRQACCHPRIGSSGRRLAVSQATRILLPASRSRGKKLSPTEVAKKRAKNPLDMADVLESMISKANLEMQESFRMLVGANNGLAGLSMINHAKARLNSVRVRAIAEAIVLYRESLQLETQYNQAVHLDVTQRLHILVNLSEALAIAKSLKDSIISNPEQKDDTSSLLNQLASLGRTLREENMEQEAEEIRKGYIGGARGTLQKAQNIQNELTSELGENPLYDDEFVEESSDEDDVNDDDDERDNSNDINDNGNGKNDVDNDCIENSNTGTDGDDNHNSDGMDGDHPNNDKADNKKRRRPKIPWWQRAIAIAMEERKEDDMMEKMVSELTSVQRGENRTFRLQSHLVISSVVESDLREIQRARNCLINGLKILPGGREPTSEEIAQSGSCSSCREVDNYGSPYAIACAHCQSEHLLLGFEKKLFLVKEVVKPKRRGDPFDHDNTIGHRQIVGGFRVIDRKRSDGLRLPSDVEIILHILSRQVSRAADKRLTKQMNKWFDKYKKVKEEFLAVRKVFEAQRALLGTMDELNMALMRFSLAEKGGKNTVSSHSAIYCIPKSHMALKRSNLQGEKITAQIDLTNKRGNLSYLQGLRGNADKAEDKGQKRARSGDAECCAVCLGEYDEEAGRGILSCGHAFCRDCTLVLIQKAESGPWKNIRCPSCRIVCKAMDVSFATKGRSAKRQKCEEPRRQDDKDDEGDKKDDNENGSSGDMAGQDDEDVDRIEPQNAVRDGISDGHAAPNGQQEVEGPRDVVEDLPEREELESSFYDELIPVVGSFGSKAAAVVQLVKGILAKESESKIVGFSEWGDVLEMLKGALMFNGVKTLSAARTSSSSKFAATIDEFKKEKNGVVLLLPLRRAGAGLNLTEARHVVLVEPSMEVRLERQAIGRVHRIGQSAVTFVHRVVMDKTIEDRILRLGDAYRVSATEEAVGLEDVMQGLNEGRGVSTVDLDSAIETHGGGEFDVDLDGGIETHGGGGGGGSDVQRNGEALTHENEGEEVLI